MRTFTLKCNGDGDSSQCLDVLCESSSYEERYIMIEPRLSVCKGSCQFIPRAHCLYLNHSSSLCFKEVYRSSQTGDYSPSSLLTRYGFLIPNLRLSISVTMMSRLMLNLHATADAGVFSTDSLASANQVKDSGVFTSRIAEDLDNCEDSFEIYSTGKSWSDHDSITLNEFQGHWP